MTTSSAARRRAARLTTRLTSPARFSSKAITARFRFGIYGSRNWNDVAAKKANMQSQIAGKGSAGFPACGFGQLSSRPVHGTGKSREPADKNVCATGLSRRKFIASSAWASAAFMILPSHVLGRGGAKSPNEKLDIAGIGIGAQGGQHTGQLPSENIVALCDVDWAHA